MELPQERNENTNHVAFLLECELFAMPRPQKNQSYSESFPVLSVEVLPDFQYDSIWR